MSKVLNKRDSLERFVREQTIGPGINGYRFVDLFDELLVGKDLYNEDPINYSNEILNIVPAAVYSTGILFPENRSDSGLEGIILDNNELVEPKDDAKGSDSQDNSLESVDSDDDIELNQMHPRTMGLTCCLDEKCLKENSIEFLVSFRHYSKLKQDREGRFNKRYALLCEVNIEALRSFLVRNKFQHFSIQEINNNNFLLLPEINKDDIPGLRSSLRDIQKSTAVSLFEKTKALTNLGNLTSSGCNLSNLKSSIYFGLKNSISDESSRKILYDICQVIELTENIVDHLVNLLDVYSQGYGLWQASLVQRKIKIDGIDFPKSLRKKSFLYNKTNDANTITVLDGDNTLSNSLANLFKCDLQERDDYASLSANIQLSRDSRKANDRLFIKIQLINTSVPYKKEAKRFYSGSNELVNQKSFFGVKISIENEHLIPYTEYSYTPTSNGDYDEDSTTQFIYNQYQDYGIGHGCSVKWNNDAKIIRVETEYLPECETPDVDPIPRDKSKPAVKEAKNGFVAPLFSKDTKNQEFKWLSIFSDSSDADVVNGLIDFADAYGYWIDLKRKNVKYQNQFKKIASQELDKCENDFKRIKYNILNFLSGDKNKDNLTSFRLMNGAMFMQLWHSVKTRQNDILPITEKDDFTFFDFEFYSNANDKLFSQEESAGWRAFQLAFILLNLDGIFKLEDDSVWEQRNEWVDLVWFPTGGGKTEAYLGLIALTIINRRRLYKEEGGGTAAIMRYTLRLLTMQQFQRASLVIMALELLRRWGSYNLGLEPINIGLWVGDDSLPNLNVDLIKQFGKLNEGITNKIPFSNCPWCNAPLSGETKEDTEKTSSIYNQNRVHLKCTNNKCPFSFGLGRNNSKKKDQGPIPVCLSDESIYQHPPSLLLGTVDKFAQLAHKLPRDGKGNFEKSDSRRIFGRGNWEPDKPASGYLPPDLIIQDELHLLLGPLGSAVALFECAIDQLCTRNDGTRAKVISSTATTRNTQLQIAALFDRKVNLFPKPGVECDDSFYAFYKRSYANPQMDDEKYLSNRKYIGLLPTGRTQIWMQMRLAAIILTHRAIFELKELGDNDSIDFSHYKKFEKAMDFYHTTVSYFNSLKEVGKTQSQIQSYILKELRRVFNRVIRPQKMMHSLYTYGPIAESELTGRLSGEEVKNSLKAVETKWLAENRFAHRENSKIVKGKISPEFVIATNMISVGIDVSRFNTIIINSMPRNTAEYIQASSRVARSDYGLVFTIHHPFRARDVSHYEKFTEFHEKMYSYVEPISITPFTRKSVERYMGLYLATLIRHTNTRFTNRVSARDISRISEYEVKDIIDSLVEYFELRRKRLSKFDKLVSNLLKEENVDHIKQWIEEAFKEWRHLSINTPADTDLIFNNKRNSEKQMRKQEQLYVDIEEYEANIHSEKWRIPMSLRVIEPEAAIKINSK